MKKGKEFNQLGIGEKMKLSESLGAKVAKIMNMAREKCNVLLQATGYGINIKVDFYRLDQPQEAEVKEEVTNG